MTVRTTSLIRAVIVSSLFGHWVANALFDRDEYAGAGQELLTRLDDPFLIQALLGSLVVVGLSIWDRRRSGELPSFSGRRLPLAVLLVGLQLLLFVCLESSERLVVEAFADGNVHVGIFGAGFVAELVVAVGSAIVVAIVAGAAKQLLELIRPAVAREAPEPRASISLGFAPSLRVVSGAGPVRGPPRQIADA